MAERDDIIKKAKEMRIFLTGATRDADNGKHDPEGFLSPLVINRYNEYMHHNRFQKDGNMRDSGNWQRGIPREAYMKSMWRHFQDVWSHHRGFSHIAKEPLEEALCAVMFNSMGMLFEILKEKEASSSSSKEVPHQAQAQ